MSGLHFTTSSDYFCRIKLFDYQRIFKNRRILKKYFSHHALGFHNEAFLLDLYIQDTKNIDEQISFGDVRNLSTDNYSFRPHHGLHLGIFRHSSTIKAEKYTIDSQVYSSYFNIFIEEYNRNIILKEFILEDTFLSVIFDNIIKYYQEKNKGKNNVQKNT